MIHHVELVQVIWKLYDYLLKLNQNILFCVKFFYSHSVCNFEIILFIIRYGPLNNLLIITFLVFH